MKVELSPFDSVSVNDVMEPCVGSSPIPGTNPASGGGSARSWMRVCCPDSGGLLSRKSTRSVIRPSAAGFQCHIQPERRCKMCSPGRTSRVSIGGTQGGCETTPIGVAQNGNSGGSTEQTATRSLKVCPGRGKRFDLVVITRNESRFRSSTVERRFRTPQTVVRFLPEAPRPSRTVLYGRD